MMSLGRDWWCVFEQRAADHGGKSNRPRLWCKISTCWSSTEWDGVQNGHNSLKPYLCAKRDYCALHLLQINRKVSKAFLRGTTIRCMTHYVRPFKHTHALRHREGSITISSFTDHHKYKWFKWTRLTVLVHTHMYLQKTCLCASYYTTCIRCSQSTLLSLVSSCHHQNISARLMPPVTSVFSWSWQPNLNIRRII